jgi:tetratricopeptide (TPR) repeat protein
MTDKNKDLRTKLEQAVKLPYGVARSSLVEEILTHAEAVGEPRLVFDVRMRLIEAFTFGAEPAKAFAPFAACLAEYDRGAIPFSEKDNRALLWRFKWIIAAMPKFPTIERPQVEAALADMERRYRIGGHSMHAVHTLQCTIRSHLGDRDAAEEAFRLWLASERDRTSDCEACEASERAAHHVWMGRDKSAIKAARPVVDRQLTCLEEPQGILVEIMQALVRTGKLEQARDAHLRAYRLHRGRPDVVNRVGAHLEFCARTGNEARGLEILNRHISWLDEPTDPSSALAFTASAALLLRRLEKVGPAGLTIERAAARVPLDELRSELEQRARAIAALFDVRNGNNYQGGRIEELLAAEPLIEWLPLSASERFRSSVAATPERTPTVSYSRPDRTPAAAKPISELDGPALLTAAQAADERWLRFSEAEQLYEPEALETALTAVQLWRQTPDRANRAVAELHLGTTYHALEEWLDAAEALELARYDFEQAGLGESADAEQTCYLLGECQQELHENLDAGATFGHMADVMTAAGRPERAAILLSKAAAALAKGGEPGQAAVRYGEAAAAYQLSGSLADAVRTLREQVDAFEDAGNSDASYDTAVKTHKLVHTLPDNGRYEWLKASTTYDIAYALYQQDRNEEAIPMGRQAAAEYESSGHLSSAATTMRLVGRMYFELCRWDEATEIVTAAREMFVRAGEKETGNAVVKTQKLLDSIEEARETQ